MALSNIDELNAYEYVYTDSELDKILTEYYEVMDIDDTQKEKRKDLAKQIRDSLLFLFVLIEVAYEYDYLTYDNILSQFRNQFQQSVFGNIVIDSYMEQYIQKVTKDVVDTTFKKLDLINPNYWTSDERAIIVGENEANSILNYEELQEAIEQGYTMKKWITEKDNRVRKTHRAVDEKIIPIEDYFEFPDCKGLFPHDYENLSDKELANCRCSLKYS